MIPRPTRASWARCIALGMVGAWVLPMPWQHSDPVETAAEPVRLGPAALGGR